MATRRSTRVPSLRFRLVVLTAFLLLGLSSGFARVGDPPSALPAPAARTAPAVLPAAWGGLSFVENRGQWGTLS